MLGAIIGDIVGSPYEFHNIKTKDFPLFSDDCRFTDDTILTCATAEWLTSNNTPQFFLRKWGKMYADRTYENGTINAFGLGFSKWLEDGKAYGAKTNGCIMRLSPIPHLIKDMHEGMQKAEELTSVTHNHPESILATRAYVETAYLLKEGISSEIIRNRIAEKYGYDLSESVEQIRPHYNKFYCSCKNSVPQAIACALEADSYEDALRNAVSLGGDSDTLACMAGGLAEFRFGVPQEIASKAREYFDENVAAAVKKFCLRKNENMPTILSKEPQSR